METIIEKIQKLLALSGSPNEHEAALALTKARELMEKHNLSMATVEGTEIDKSAFEDTLVYECGRQPEYEVIPVCVVLNKISFVKTVVLQRDGVSRYMIFGHPDNLAVAKHTFHYLRGLYRRLWQQYRTRHGLGRGQARTYYFGLSAGLAAKVLAERRMSDQDANALVVVGNALTRSFNSHYGHTKSKKATVRGNQETYADGVRDGAKINLHKPVEGAARPERKAING